MESPTAITTPLRLHVDAFEVRDRTASVLPEEEITALSSTGGKVSSALASKRIRYALIAVGCAVAVIGLSLLAYFLTRPSHDAATMTAYQQACTVFCSGGMLSAIQMARVFNDSKTFVDMPMTMDPPDILAAFQVAFPNGNGTREELAAFVAKHFTPAGNDSIAWVPTDYVPSPAVLMSLQNETLRDFALGLNDLWLQLGRQIIDSVREYPQRYSLVWQPNPMIVPGGRFVESYYWDTYWVIMGLLRSEMYQTAMGVALNLVHMLDLFGFVPNGGRVYYALPGRSQPPLLSAMVREIYEATGNITFLAQVYPSLQTEHAWWMKQGDYGHAVVIEDSNGSTHVLNRYVTDQHTARPESFYEDEHTVTEAGYTPSSAAAKLLFSEIAAGAETGWDFSSRWFADGKSITECITSFVVPADLNAFLYDMEVNLAYFASALNAYASVTCGAAAPGAADGVGTAGSRVGSSRPTVARSPRAAYPGRQLGSVSYDDNFCDMMRAHPLCVVASESGGGGGGAAPQEGSELHQSNCLLRVGTALQADSILFEDAASSRAAAMEALLWDEGLGAWTDLYLPSDQVNDPRLAGMEAVEREHAHAWAHVAATGSTGGLGTAARPWKSTQIRRSNITTASNYVPLWAGVYDPTNATRVQRIVASAAASPLLQVGGVATTVDNTTQQWDWPNGWAPLQHMLIRGLEDAQTNESEALAYSLAARWVASCYVAYVNTGYMHEKYDVLGIGDTGAGGEYTPQVGFGWTNGAALDLLVRYNFTSLHCENV